MANRLQRERPSRLKPPPCIDPLDRIGLVSKGDKGLLSYKTQEEYFETIKTRYHTFIDTSDNRNHSDDDFATTFASLSLNRNATSISRTSVAAQTAASDPAMSTIIMAMRKLREAIVASCRVDDFAKETYIFIIRTTILLGHPESYHPALLHLLHRIHFGTPLSSEETREFVGYYIFDLACRQHDFTAAFRVRKMYKCSSRKIDMTLTALVHRDWFLFQNVKRSANGNVQESRLMEWADGRMTDYAVQCLEKSYLSVSKVYVEQCTGMEWDKLKEQKKVSWALEGETVMIRQMKKR
ncbi:MAG: hypothetical protein Q9224_000878 [Gallowayella concinna]